MSAALTAQPGLNRAATAVSTKAKHKGRNRKRKKSTMGRRVCNTDGETEWVNQEIETYLRLFCQGQPDKWSDLIPMAEFAHNSATHSSTQKSLFSLILGYCYNLLFPFASTQPHLILSSPRNHHPAVLTPHCPVTTSPRLFFTLVTPPSRPRPRPRLVFVLVLELALPLSSPRPCLVLVSSPISVYPSVFPFLDPVFFLL